MDGTDLVSGGAGSARSPVQQRSRERRAKILEAAKALIRERGSDRLRMNELAQAAAVSMGSLYQYFPEKSAVIHALAEAFNLESRRCITEALAEVRTLESLRRAFKDLYETYYALVRAEPVVRDIWAGMQADRALADLQVAENRAMGGLLAAAALRVRPDLDPNQLATDGFAIWELGEAAVRLAVSVPAPEGDRVVELYTEMVLQVLDSLLGDR